MLLRCNAFFADTIRTERMTLEQRFKQEIAAFRLIQLDRWPGLAPGIRNASSAGRGTNSNPAPDGGGVRQDRARPP